MKGTPEKGRLLTIRAAAVELGMSEWTLRDLIATGAIPVIRPPGVRRLWIDRRDLEHVLTTWREQGS